MNDATSATSPPPAPALWRHAFAIFGEILMTYSGALAVAMRHLPERNHRHHLWALAQRAWCGKRAKRRHNNGLDLAVDVAKNVY